MNNFFSYGLWPLVIINSAVFIIFAFSFTGPKTTRDWRSFGAFSAFIIALFTEMYGFPLTIYLLSSWLLKKYPALDLYSHNTGHLWETLLGWKADPHFNPLHLVGDLFIGSGLLLLVSAWSVLYKGKKKHALATTGPYAFIRHPQYVSFIMVMIGFLLQWPTILTLMMFPVLIFMYIRLVYREEQEISKIFGKEYEDYRKKTPAFIPVGLLRKMIIAND